MRKKFMLLTLFIFCLCLLTGCQCEHEWIEADCVTSKTCSKCNETEGTALEHDWLEATCTEGKHCIRCEEVAGEPLGHIPGEWTETLDIVTCTVDKSQYCTECGTLLDSETAQIDSLVKDGMFIFTPYEFMERLTYLGRETFSDFEYEFESDDDSLLANVSFDGKEATVYFFNADTTFMHPDDMQNTGVWSVSLNQAAESDPDLLHAYFLACDPTLEDRQLTEISLSRFTAHLNAAEYGELFGYLYKNDLLYEFGLLPSTMLELDFDIYTDLIYASNWLSE